MAAVGAALARRVCKAQRLGGLGDDCRSRRRIGEGALPGRALPWAPETAQVLHLGNAPFDCTLPGTLKMTTDDRLEEYRKKRDFRRTAEPRGGDGGGSASDDGDPRFVIQKHDASSLHYDFRLEIDGALVSWAVPKGPSTDPREKRLAVRTEDHPLDYVDFEGVIPEDEYGGGTVLVWDRGTYRNLKEEDGEEEPKSMAEALEDGHLTVWLEGEKLRGGYALTQTKMRGDPKNWLLVKMDDSEADARRNPTSTKPKSVLSGKTLEEIAADG